jgi:prepilin-type N-terminal cleavage/methylation domain-containing protein
MKLKIKFRFRWQQSGFTLIELLVVISIIGLLASIISVSTLNARKKTRDAVRRENLKQLAAALELYYSDNGHYPPLPVNPAPPPNVWAGESINGGSYALKDGGAKDAWIPGLAPKYMAQLPHDPNTGTDSGFCANQSPPGAWSGYIYDSDGGSNYKVISVCTPETIRQPSGDPSDPFYDPGAGGSRTNNSWQISTPAFLSY